MIKKRDNEQLGQVPFVHFATRTKEELLSYPFATDVMVDATDDEVLDMFTRLNQYTVTLNKQEKRNARYHGEFKSAMYSLAGRNLSFFREYGILSERNVMRMGDAELVSELVVAMMDGLQDKKKSLDQFYKRYDGSFPQERAIGGRLGETLSDIARIFGQILSMTQFKKRVLFYSLFCVIYDVTEGLPKQEDSRHGRISDSNLQAAQRVVRHLSNQIEADVPSREYVEFVNACRQQTDNLQPRQIRHDTIKAQLLPLV
jgi:hypothetical protein